MGIHVQNISSYKGYGTYIGRPNGEYKGSILANPYPIDEHCSRERCIQLYEAHLISSIKLRNKDAHSAKIFEELIRLRNKVLYGKEVNLVCWCAPKPCHGDILKRVLEWMVQKYQEKHGVKHAYK